MPERIFSHDDAGVDQDANSNRDAGKRHHVRRDVGVVHQQERAQHGERQGQRHNQDAAEMHEEHNMRERDKDDLLNQRMA